MSQQTHPGFFDKIKSFWNPPQVISSQEEDISTGNFSPKSDKIDTTNLNIGSPPRRMLPHHSDLASGILRNESSRIDSSMIGSSGPLSGPLSGPTDIDLSNIGITRTLSADSSNAKSNLHQNENRLKELKPARNDFNNLGSLGSSNPEYNFSSYVPGSSW